MEPRWVRQEDACGCSVAVLAMITGLPYRQVREEVGFDGTLASSCGYRQVEWLKARGYEVITRFWRIFEPERERFLPTDRPYFLWVSVGCNEWRHSVLLLPNGTVMDPDTPEPRRLTDYPEACSVSAVVG